MEPKGSGAARGCLGGTQEGLVPGSWWVQIPAPSLTSCVTVGKWLNLSGLPFSQL